MDIETPLSRTEIILAWWRTTHELHGSFYRSFDRDLPMTEPRTIINVSRDGEHVIVTLSDGAQYQPGGYPAVGSPDNPRYTVALRDPGSPTGALLDEAPSLSYEAAKLFEAAGISDAEVLATIARGPDAPASSTETVVVGSDESSAAESSVEAPPAPQVPPKPPVEAHNRHAEELHRIAFAIERGAQFFVHEIVELIHRVV